MKRDDALRMLAAHRGELTTMGVREPAMFGSVAGDKAGDDGDLDVLVDYLPGRRLSDLRVFDLQERLEESLGANIADAPEAIEGSIAGPTPDQFSNDRFRVDAVVKNLTDLGETAGCAPSSVVEADSQIPWPRMRAMRSVLVHEYFGLDQGVLRGRVTDDLKPWCLSSPACLPRREMPAQPCPQGAFKPAAAPEGTQALSEQATGPSFGIPSGQVAGRSEDADRDGGAPGGQDRRPPRPSTRHHGHLFYAAPLPQRRCLSTSQIHRRA